MLNKPNWLIQFDKQWQKSMGGGFDTNEYDELRACVEDIVFKEYRLGWKDAMECCILPTYNPQSK